jgi:hypothetical protein
MGRFEGMFSTSSGRTSFFRSLSLYANKSSGVTRLDLSSTISKGEHSRQGKKECIKLAMARGRKLGSGVAESLEMKAPRNRELERDDVTQPFQPFCVKSLDFS